MIRKKKEKTIVDTLINGKVDGLLVSIASGTSSFDHFKQTIEKGVPLIFFDRTTTQLEASRVEIDDFQGAYMAVTHLIDQGCKRIAHFSGPLNVSIYNNRYKGYLTALQDKGIKIDIDLHMTSAITRETGADAVDKLLKMKKIPDGIFSASDYSALGAIIRLKERNIKIPDEIAVVGFANEPYAAIITPSLTSVDQHSREVGQSVAKLFLEEIKSQTGSGVSKRIMLSPDLIIRDSSKKVQ